LADIEDYIAMKIPVSSVEDSLIPDLREPLKAEYSNSKKKDGFSRRKNSRSKKK